MNMLIPLRHRPLARIPRPRLHRHGAARSASLRQRRPRQLAVLALLVISLAGSLLATGPGARATAQPAAPSGSVTALLLRPSDLPAGLTARARRAITPAQAARGAQLTVATLRHAGWQAAADATYQRATPGTGLALVAVTMNVFQGANGAHWYVRHALEQARRSMSGAQSPKRIAVGTIGDESAGWTMTRGLMSGETILFRHGRYVVTLTGAGLARVANLGQVVALARRQDHRLAQAPQG